MTRKEQIQKAADELCHGCEGEQDDFELGAEWADKNPDFCIDKPVTDFKIYITRRLDFPGPDNWMVRVADQAGAWFFDGMGAFKDCLGFAEMGMQAVNESVRKAKSETGSQPE